MAKPIRVWWQLCVQTVSLRLNIWDLAPENLLAIKNCQATTF